MTAESQHTEDAFENRAPLPRTPEDLPPSRTSPAQAQDQFRAIQAAVEATTARDGANPDARTSKHILLGPALGPAKKFHSRIGTMLLEHRLVTREELERALEIQKTTHRRIGEILVAMRAVTSVDLARVLAEHLRMPFVDLRTSEPDPDVATLITEDVARRYDALPITRWAGKIVVAMATPNHHAALDELRAMLDAPALPAVAEPGELRRAIAAVYASPARRDGVADMASGTVRFPCPGCNEPLIVSVTPWVMQEMNREAGVYYIWDNDPATSPPLHVCSRA